MPMAKSKRTGRTETTRASNSIPEAPTGETFDLPVDSVSPSPDNPRKQFDEKRLRELADSIAEIGQIQPIVVLPAVEGRYEIVAGERRWRACRIAGLATVRAEIRPIAPREAAIVRLVENGARDPLNAVEEARAFRQATTGPDGWTQRELADRLGVSASFVGNRIRLLKLPDEWLDRLVSDEITETQARELIPWAEYPDVLASIQAGLTTTNNAREKLSGNEFADEIEAAVRDVARNMSADPWVYKPRLFAPTETQRKALDIKKFGHREYALNTALFDQLQADAQAKATRREKVAAEKQAQRSLDPETERENERAKAESFARKLARYRTRWQQTQIADRLRTCEEPGLLLRLACHCMVYGQPRAKEAALREAIEGSTAEKPVFAEGLYFDLEALGRGEEVSGAARHALARIVSFDVESGAASFRAGEIDRLADELGIDLENDWTLDREFLELHTLSQLRDLAAEWGATCGLEGMTRAELLNTIEREARKAPCPRELRTLKAPE
jgi:ParB/RepB/Spo0J family partition protein